MLRKIAVVLEINTPVKFLQQGALERVVVGHREEFLPWLSWGLPIFIFLQE